jgi:molecular chaperone GrpE
MTRIPIHDDNLDGDSAEPAGATESPDPDGDAAAEAARDAEWQRLRAENERLQAERDSLFERLARETADFKNMRRRTEQETDQKLQYANSALIKSLLPVIDNFERALAVEPAKADAKSILKGLQLVHDQWINVLKQQQVEEIAPAPGTPFDPERHQAIMQQESKYKEPTVVQLLQKGYALHDRTLRPAQVAVSKTQ